MADAQQQRWAARLREGRNSGFSSVDARLAVSAVGTATMPGDGQEEEGPSYGTRLDRQSLQPTEEQEEETPEDAGSEAPSRIAQVAEAGVQQAAGIGWKAVDKWLYGLAIPSFGLTIFAIDIVYISRHFSSRVQKLVPQAPIWEVVVLLTLSTLLFVAYMLAFMITMLPIIVVNASATSVIGSIIKSF